MQQHMLKLGIVLTAVVMAAGMGGWVPLVFAKPALVEVTGQTTSYADGDDGDIQAGVPFPTPRFTDKGDGTVKDNLTNLIWLKNANCFPGSSGLGLTWQAALTAANNLADDPASTATDCGLSDGSVAGDWRLPNVKELQSLIDFGHFNPALPSGHPFAGVQSAFYWSSTTHAGGPGVAWSVHLGDGSASFFLKGFFISPTFVWPVRGGE
jgi:hypothetical protein